MQACHQNGAAVGGETPCSASARKDEVGFLRKQKPMFDLTDLAAVAVMGHELMIAEAASISNDDQAAERQRTIADAVLQDIGGIRRFALLMNRLSTETAEGEQRDDKLFEISGYDAARARLFPAEAASGNSSKSAKRISPSSSSPPRKPRFGIWHCPRCNVEWTQLLTAEDVCATCGSALDDVRPSVKQVARESAPREKTFSDLLKATSQQQWQMGDPPQEIWNTAFERLGSVMRFLGDESNSPTTAEKAHKGHKVVIEALTTAHYSFAELAEAGLHVQYTKPLEGATKDMLEGWINGDTEQVTRGMGTARDIVLRHGADQGWT